MSKYSRKTADRDILAEHSRIVEKQLRRSDMSIEEKRERRVELRRMTGCSSRSPVKELPAPPWEGIFVRRGLWRVSFDGITAKGAWADQALAKSMFNMLCKKQAKLSDNGEVVFIHFVRGEKKVQ